MSRAPSPGHHSATAAAGSSSSSHPAGANAAGKAYDRVGPFEIQEEIGRGSFATVFKGLRVQGSQTGAAVAIKAVTRRKLTPKLLDNLESEIRLLKGINHRHVTELVDCLKTESHIYLVMAYCPAGDLSGYLKKRGLVEGLPLASTHAFPHPPHGGLNTVVVRSFLKQLAEALEFLRSQDIIHRDIKPQNLLLSPDPAADTNPPLLQVADFGFARLLPQASMAETLCGSPLYMAPEILRYEKYDAKADLWSTGAVLYEMCVGRPPFRAQNHVELLKKIERSQDRIKFPDEQPPSDDVKLQYAKEHPVADDLKALVRRLLKRNPVERMSFNDFFPQVAQVTASAVAAQATKDAPASRSSSPASRPATPSSKAAAAPQLVNRRSQQPSSHSPPAITNDYPQQPLPRASTPSSFPPRYIVGPSSTSTSAPSQIRNQEHPLQSPAGFTSSSRQPTLPPNTQKTSAAAPRASTSAPTRAGTLQQQQFATDREGLDGSRTGDSMLAREYVVIEKGPVEINALADELAARPPNLQRKSTRGFLARPPLAPPSTSASGDSAGVLAPQQPPSPRNQSPASKDNALIPYPPTVDLHTPAPFALSPMPGAPHASSSNSPVPRPRTVSYPRSFSYSAPFTLPQVSSSGKAVAKAFNMASLKLFGNPADGILLRRPTPKTAGTSKVISDSQESALISELEDLGQKATVVFDFADTKLMQLLPPTPQTATAYTNAGSYFPPQHTPPSSFSPFTQQHKRRSGSSSSLKRINEDEADSVAAEALVLYLKALTFLQRGIEKARAYWDIKVADSTTAASPEFNEAVQWLRLRFNDCHEKAEFVKSKLGEQDEPSVSDSTPSAEKLIYDRALEMSRAAAVNELMGENAADCEVAYETALYMLYAIMDSTASPQQQQQRNSNEEDRTTVNKFVASIQGRLTSLRKKMVTR